MSIHESADVPKALTYWSEVVGVAPESFGRTQLTKHNPKTVRRNVGEDYHGCLLIYVRRSADHTLRIAGWCEGLTALCER